MRQAVQNQEDSYSREMTVSVNHRLREGTLIIFIAVAAFLFLTLITYSSNDPSWSSSGVGSLVANDGGLIGAWLSDILLYSFGLVAYLFPVMLLFSAWFVLYGRIYDVALQWSHVFLRFVGAVLITLSSCGLASLLLSAHLATVPLSSGGVIGGAIESRMIVMLSTFGSVLVLTTFLLIGITLFTSISWLSVFRVVCKGIFAGCVMLHERYAEWRERIHDEEVRGEGYEDDDEYEEDEEDDDEKANLKAKNKEEFVRSIGETIIHKPKFQNKADRSKLSGVDSLPSLSLLEQPQKSKQIGFSEEHLETLSRLIEKKLLDFDVEAYVVAVHPGPVITRFELELAPGLKVNRITALVKDLARSLSIPSVRVVEVIPGKAVIGLEVPNDNRQTVYLRELFESKQYVEATSPLSLALGKDISGYPTVIDLAKTPHLLVSGTTGSGKSVSVNAMIFSILYKATPENVRFIMVDPKMLELSVYDGIPHLLTPVVTDMKQAANAFRWCVAEMERRYQLMSSLKVRHIDGYNAKVQLAINNGEPLINPLVTKEDETEDDEPETLETLPYIVVVVDELSDMMMVVGKKVEELIARIAQKARAAGIHMILATQRPSVDVITGLIKANIPTRIAFQVSSKIDSRTILDQSGAEQLLGYGDMLYLPPGAGMPVRLHGAYVSDNELHRVIHDWKKRGKPEYLNEVLEYSDDEEDGGDVDRAGSAGEQDVLYDKAVQIVAESRRASISYVQRRLKIGYNRSANILEAMEEAGVVSKMESNGAREVLVPPPQE